MTRELEWVLEQTSALKTQVAGNHYKNMAIQVVEYCHLNKIGYMEGNVIKYVSRWRNKNGIEDLKKARHYLDLLIEMEENAISTAKDNLRPECQQHSTHCSCK